jgi:hypothetical protein
MITETEGYESHLAVLDTLPFKHVLEFGAGEHSTAFFIERAISVTSVETDPEWLDWATLKYLDADNLTLTRTRPKSLAKFDLVFIDDGQTSKQRVETLTWVMSRKNRPMTVVHDAEVPEYRAVLDGMCTMYELRCEQSPFTAVVP